MRNVAPAFRCILALAAELAAIRICESGNGQTFFRPYNLSAEMEQHLVEFAGIDTFQTWQTDITSQPERFSLCFANSTEYDQFRDFILAGSYKK